MSDVRKTPVAITTSDWHIRGTVPASRAELDWYKVMDRRLGQLADLQKEHDYIPILVCGDLFDRPNPHANLVKWFVDKAQELDLWLWVIPGQHDCYGHDLAYVDSSAYGLATSFAKVHHLTHGAWKILTVNGASGQALALWAMPWGHYELPEKLPKGYDHIPKVAMVHKYMFPSKSKAYVTADEEGAVTAHTAWGKYFDVIAIGDNHISWRAGKFLNHGSLFSMTSAQKDHEHLIGVVYSDGSLETVTLPEEKQWKEVYVPPESSSRAEALLAELAATELDAVAFDELLDRLEGVLSDGAREQLRAIRQGN